MSIVVRKKKKCEKRQLERIIKARRIETKKIEKEEKRKKIRDDNASVKGYNIDA